MAVLGLRERQKADRRKRILAVAIGKFQNEGYANVTIEMIANDADVSAVTVYNYYGSKVGLLLALVKESDVLLITQLQSMIDSRPDNLIDAVADFGQILRQHAMSYLSKPTWREVLAATILEGSKEFGRTYVKLDNRLIELMRALIEDQQSRGKVSQSIDSAILADSLFSLQNIRFFQFVADDDISDADIDRKFRADLGTILHGIGVGN